VVSVIHLADLRARQLSLTFVIPTEA
jgi:hypothetical protein